MNTLLAKDNIEIKTKYLFLEDITYVSFHQRVNHDPNPIHRYSRFLTLLSSSSSAIDLVTEYRKSCCYCSLGGRKRSRRQSSPDGSEVSATKRNSEQTSETEFLALEYFFSGNFS